MLQNCLNSKENFSIENFEGFFIRDLNLNSDSTIQKEANSLDIVSDRTNITVANIDIQLNEANQKLEKLKIEKKSAEETKILSKSKSQSTTQENYMDYYQDSSGSTNTDFERKSYYQWQWAEMQKTGIQKTYFEQIK
jgi:hypothetical protein